MADISGDGRMPHGLADLMCPGSMESGHIHLDETRRLTPRPSD